jgi:hypothetical protein
MVDEIGRREDSVMIFNCYLLILYVVVTRMWSRNSRGGGGCLVTRIGG